MLTTGHLAAHERHVLPFAVGAVDDVSQLLVALDAEPIGVVSTGNGVLLDVFVPAFSTVLDGNLLVGLFLAGAHRSRRLWCSEPFCLGKSLLERGLVAADWEGRVTILERLLQSIDGEIAEKGFGDSVTGSILGIAHGTGRCRHCRCCWDIPGMGF